MVTEYHNMGADIDKLNSGMKRQFKLYEIILKIEKYKTIRLITIRV